LPPGLAPPAPAEEPPPREELPPTPAAVVTPPLAEPPDLGGEPPELPPKVGVAPPVAALPPIRAVPDVPPPAPEIPPPEVAPPMVARPPEAVAPPAISPADDAAPAAPLVGTPTPFEFPQPGASRMANTLTLATVLPAFGPIVVVSVWDIFSPVRSIQCMKERILALAPVTAVLIRAAPRRLPSDDAPPTTAPRMTAPP